MKITRVRGRKPKPIELTEDERARLIEFSRRSKSANAVARRARIVLAAADGMGNTEMSRRLGVSVGTAVKWRARFLKLRMVGLLDEPRVGAPRTVTDAVGEGRDEDAR
jgi:predicted transcriptional regulator